MLKRSDMLELTRRMTPQRTCFSRIAGAYMDVDGYIDGTFNTNFLKLDNNEKNRCLGIAKAIPFSDTNVLLKEYEFEKNGEQAKIKTMLNSLLECGLKNDAMLEVLYELIGEKYKAHKDYAIYVFFGRFDVPVKGSDNVWLEGSEEVYEFLITAVFPLEKEYTPGKPLYGFLYPSFSDRSSDYEHIAVYDAR